MMHSKKASSILSLGQKSFFLRPVCLDKYLRQLDLTESAREVFWYHWGIGYRNRSLTTQLSIEHIAQYLHISSSTVSRAYEQLTSVGLIRRSVDKAIHGGYDIAKTTIDLPDTVLVALLADHPDRPCEQKPAETAEKQRSPDIVEISASPGIDSKPTKDQPSRASPPPEKQAEDCLTSKIEWLDQEIQAWNTAAIQCSNEKDIAGFRNAVRHAEQAQRQRDRLLAQLNAKEKKHVADVTAEIPVIEQQARAATRSDPTPASNAPSEVPGSVDPDATRSKRRLSPTTRAQIKQQIQAIPRVSNPSEVAQEIIYSIERGVHSVKPIPWAINAALGLIKTNRWRTPYGYNGGSLNLGEGVLSR